MHPDASGDPTLCSTTVLSAVSHRPLASKHIREHWRQYHAKYHDLDKSQVGESWAPTVRGGAASDRPATTGSRTRHTDCATGAPSGGARRPARRSPRSDGHPPRAARSWPASPDQTGSMSTGPGRSTRQSHPPATPTAVRVHLILPRATPSGGAVLQGRHFQGPSAISTGADCRQRKYSHSWPSWKPSDEWTSQWQNAIGAQFCCDLEHKLPGRGVRAREQY